MEFGSTPDRLVSSRLITERYKNVRTVIITMGEKGSFVYDTAERRMLGCTAIKTKVVSTVGAGDSFSAAFLHGFLSGESLEACLSSASRLAAKVVAHREAVPE